MGACLALGAAPVYAFDPLLATHGVTPNAAGALADGEAGFCTFGPLGDPLKLPEVVERALCNNAKTRQAWAAVKEQAANVGFARAAYLPTMSVQGQKVRDDSVTNVTGEPQLSQADRATISTASITANWVLWDFGGRRAALDNASALLAAARANQDATLQTTFATVVKDYYAAQAAQGALAAAEETEQTAKESAAVAQARVDHGAAPVSDALQAQTSFAQAVFARAKAEGELESALGTLAVDMNLTPTDAITLPAVTDGVTPDAGFNESIEDLIDEARRTHPSVIAAQQQLEASLAKVRQVRAQGLPTLSFVSKYTTDNQPASLGLGVPEFPATGHDWYFGIQLTIPLFEGFGRHYQVRQAEAQSEQQQDAVDQAQQQVAIDVWNAYQALKTSEENLTNTESLLSIAAKSFDAAEHRYGAGVGSILELLNAQSALADAKRQRIQALTDWRDDRLQLAAKLGRLGLHDLDSR